MSDKFRMFDILDVDMGGVVTSAMQLNMMVRNLGAPRCTACLHLIADSHQPGSMQVQASCPLTSS